MTTLFPPPSPTLPEFRTLLINGNYHASAPIHLCVSHLAQSDTTQAVLIYPSRAKFTCALKESTDGWLNEHGGEGTFSRHTRNVQVLYSSHLLYDYGNEPAERKCARLAILRLQSTSPSYSTCFIRPKTRIRKTIYARPPFLPPLLWSCFVNPLRISVTTRTRRVCSYLFWPTA